LNQLSWLSGRWRGDRKGAAIEETWSAPLGRTMIGSFRAVEGGTAKFFELLTITDEGGVMMRIRHFDPGLVAWEEKDAPLAYRLLSSQANEAAFENVGSDPVRVIRYRRSGDRLTVRLEKADGIAQEFQFSR
jgi:hypothetical protein